MNKNRSIQILAMITALAGLWIFRHELSGMWAWFSSMSAVTTSMHAAGIWGPIVLFVLFVLQVFLAFIPGQALMVACGYLYGFWGGFLLSWLSLVVGGEMAFMLARKYGGQFAERWIAPDILSRWDEAALGQGISFFAIMLVMPLVPNDAMCYVAGLGTISRRRFIIANLLGRGMACGLPSSSELVTVKVRYKDPDGEISRLLEVPFRDSGAATASADFTFAAGVAAFGLALRAADGQSDRYDGQSGLYDSQSDRYDGRSALDDGQSVLGDGQSAVDAGLDAGMLRRLLEAGAGGPEPERRREIVALCEIWQSLSTAAIVRSR